MGGAGAERPFFFDCDGIRLFGVVHRPSAPEPRPGSGVVLCHPYGEEKQFSHRVLVRFARRLAERGLPALRFDHRGYGDSEGEVEESTVETQVGETQAVVERAKEWLQVDRVVLLGLRFGATVAALVAERRPEIAGLVLWSPIVKGQAYVDELVRKHLFAQLTTGTSSLTRAQVRESLAREGRIEVEGNYLTSRMAEQIAAIDLPEAVRRFRNPVLVTAVENRRGAYAPFEALVGAYQGVGARSMLAVAERRQFWDDRSMYEAYFPDELYQETLRWLETAESAP